MPDRSSQPYVGPRPFETSDRVLFFGREREANDILSLIMFHRTVLLYAQSGAGKSSLINTLIVPGLQEAGYSNLYVVRIRGAPGLDLRAADNIFVFNIQNAIAPDTTAQPDGETISPKLVDILKNIPLSASGQGPILIFDQFEELFTIHQDRWRDREGLFRQIADALVEIPTLRFLFSMREDFIAELDPLLWHIPQGIDARYRLELLRRDSAAAAVAEPARQCGVDFDRAAVERIVGDLRQINIEQPGGPPRQVEGENVEPVQLQIVCRRLWERIPQDINTIMVDHLEQFGDVSEALREFYAAAVAATAQQTRYPEKLIHLGCTQFVTSSGTRSIVHRDGDNVGRLPATVVDSLVDHHFLRAEIRAGARWYEISHDRLIAPVLERKLNDEELKTLLQTSDLLEAAVEQWRIPRYFVSDRHIVSTLTAVESELVLSEDELEFLCMNSIGANFEIPAWVRRLQAQVPALLEQILIRASTRPEAAIRQNATEALALTEFATAHQALLRLAFEDPDAEVRKHAATAMARADQTALISQAIARLSGEYRSRAHTVLARMRDAAAIRGSAENLVRIWPSIGIFDRIIITLRLAAVRLGQRWPMIAYVGTFGGLGAGLFCAIPRVPASFFALTITNDSGQNFAKAAGSGLFQGAAGGLVWGGMTAASIALGWILFRQPRRGWTKTLFIINLLFGVLGGLLGGIGVFAEIFFVFDPDALVKISWVPSRRSEALRDCIATGYCLFHPSLGPAFGGGCGLALAALHNSVGWQRFLAPHIAAGQIVEWGKTLRRTLFLSTVYSIGTVILLYASSLMFVFFKGFPLYQVLGETATIFTGNIGAVAGILLGLLIMRMGIVIPPHAD